MVSPYMGSREERGVGQGGNSTRGRLHARLTRRGAGGGGGAGEAGRGVDWTLAALGVAAVGAGGGGRHLQGLQT